MTVKEVKAKINLYKQEGSLRSPFEHMAKSTDLAKKLISLLEGKKQKTESTRQKQETESTTSVMMTLTITSHESSCLANCSTLHVHV